MFLQQLMNSNKELITYAKELHRTGEIRPDSYVLDVDAIMSNASKMLTCANQHNIELLFMLKQIGRNPYIAKRLMELGYHGAVVVDFKEAQLMMDHDIPLGNVGHLVQVPKHMLKQIIQTNPAQITVYSYEKILQIQEVAKQLDKRVSITLKVYKHGDIIYKSQEGGFALHELENVAKKVQQCSHVRIEGITAFPCFLYHENENELKTTPNVQSVQEAKLILENVGCHILHVNMPSATCIKTIPMIHSLHGTQGEPGHALTGTTPFHALNQGNYEKTAYVYVSEISHKVGERSYAFGGGYYRRGHVQQALVNEEIVQVFPAEDSAIDYHIEMAKGHGEIGDCVLMCFRTQMFVTRSDIVLVEGLANATPHVVGIYDALGKKNV